MLEILKFVMSSFWTFAGTAILLTLANNVVTSWITFLSVNIRGGR